METTGEQLIRRKRLESHLFLCASGEEGLQVNLNYRSMFDIFLFYAVCLPAPPLFSLSLSIIHTGLRTRTGKLNHCVI